MYKLCDAKIQKEINSQIIFQLFFLRVKRHQICVTPLVLHQSLNSVKELVKELNSLVS